jgi:hypothetical protein
VASVNPLVYATRRAAKQARRLLPRDACLEREIERAILQGDVCAGRAGYVFIDSRRVVAKVERHPGRLRDRPRAWLVVDVVPHNRSRLAAKATLPAGTNTAER